MSNINSMEISNWARAPPPNKPICERLARSFYDPDEKSCLGRTPRRWAILLIFYTVFYIVLALLFSCCMGVLFLTLDATKPTFTLTESLIGPSPGVSFRPRPNSEFNIRYEVDNDTHYRTYITQLHQFLINYENETWFSTKQGCNSEDSYGFPDAPCFFIKLNKMFDWEPQYFNDITNLPAEMPSDLVEYITSLPEQERMQIWISCSEEKEVGSKIEYPWGRGLPGRFYPYINKKGYKSPLLAVRITPPGNTESIIRCRAWAKNIIFNKSIREPSGYTRILLQVDYDTNNSTESTD